MTRDQRLLKWAYLRVQDFLNGEDEKSRDKYRSAVLSAPAFIQGCGLAQAIAFFNGKNDENPYKRLLDDLACCPGIEIGSGTNLVRQVPDLDLLEYMRVTANAQSGLAMLKRMVEAYCPKELAEANA